MVENEIFSGNAGGNAGGTFNCISNCELDETSAFHMVIGMLQFFYKCSGALGTVNLRAHGFVVAR